MQRRIVAHWQSADRCREAADADFSAPVAELDVYPAKRTHAFDEETTCARTFVVQFESTRQWDLKGDRAAANTDFVRHGDRNDECTKTIRPWAQPDRCWPVYGINNRNGMFQSAVQKGREFNAPCKRIGRVWFFHYPTRANVGSLGIVGYVPSDAIIGPEYQVWRLLGGSSPEFMALVLRTNHSLALAAINRVGAVKRRMYCSSLAEIRPPRVPKSVQRAFSAKRSQALGEIDASDSMLVERKAETKAMIVGNRSVQAR